MKTSTLFPSYGPRSYRFVRGLFSRQIQQFEWSLARPKDAQAQTFTDLMKGLRGTVLENAHNLSGVRTLDDFRQAVPIQSYDDVAPLVQRLLAGEKSVLSREKVRGFVETSGTQATPKLIPITRGWSAHIRRAQLLWVIGLLRDFPSISHGDIVHIVSSAAERHTEMGLPIGANTGRMVEALPKGMRKRFVLSTVPEIVDPDLRHYVHLRVALERAVRMFVTANPSTIALYARKLTEYQDFLVKDLTNGTLREGPASALPDSIRLVIEPELTKASVPLDWTLAGALPLSVVGCWTGGPASWFVRQFPTLLGGNVPVRDVGITASEGYFAIPLSSDWDGGVLWNQGEILEFQDDSGRVHWGWELEMGKEYSLIISSRNGLLRYAMRDRIRVTGFHLDTPIISFVGKEGRFINAVGEKLTEEQLVLAIHDLGQRLIGFTAIIEWAAVPKIHLGIEWKGASALSSTEFAHRLDIQLQRVSVEYSSKRQSQRLGFPRVSFWRPGVYEAFRNWRVKSGAPDAQVKDCIVATEEEWQTLKRLSDAL